MAKLTWQQRVAAYLVGNGFVEHACRTNRYRCFYKQGYGPFLGDYLLVGKAGAVRQNKTNAVSNSVSVTEGIHFHVKIWEHLQ